MDNLESSRSQTSLMVECRDCGVRFVIDPTSEGIQHKREYKVDMQSVFITHYDCPECHMRHYVQIDTVSTLEQLKEVERMFIKLAVAKKKGKQAPKSQLAKFKKARGDLARTRNELMKQFTGKLVYDSETDKSVTLEFSV